VTVYKASYYSFLQISVTSSASLKKPSELNMLKDVVLSYFKVEKVKKKAAAIPTELPWFPLL
jgi:hypothetical protein